MGTVERRRIDLQAQIRDLESRLSGLPKTQRDILAMERKLGVNEKLAVYLLEREGCHHHCPSQHHPGSLADRARTLRRQSGARQASDDSDLHGGRFSAGLGSWRRAHGVFRAH